MRLIFCVLLVACFASSCGRRSTPSEVLSKENARRASFRNQQLVIIDAGHGGKDGGSMSKRDSYEEKELTLATAFLIRNYLNQLGYNTVMTRSQDTFVPLSTRAEIANALGADLFVSVHFNYSPNAEARGVEVYYYKEGNHPPSKRIVNSKLLADNVLGKILAKTGAESRGVKQANFAVIRETFMPAILVEGGFLSNPFERAKVQDPHYQRSLAWGIVQGIDHYLEGVHSR